MKAVNRPVKTLGITLHLVFIFVLAFTYYSVSTFAAGNSQDQNISQTVAPFDIKEHSNHSKILKVRLNPVSYQSLKSVSDELVFDFPISKTENLSLQLERFEVTTPKVKFVQGTPSGDIELAPADVVIFRGQIKGEPTTHAFLAFTSTGSGNGYVTMPNGECYVMSQPASLAVNGWNEDITIHKQTGAPGLDDIPQMCGVLPSDIPATNPQFRDDVDTISGLIVAEVAIDADQSFVQLFGSMQPAQNYIVIHQAAVSDIYIRDVNMKLLLTFVRLWSAGGEPFGADDLYSFADYWQIHQDPSPYNFIHLYSGRRDLAYGGIAFVGGTCDPDGTYAISGFLNGCFPPPSDPPSNATWDIIVTAHEMGHNCGTMHTHDGYTPHIDDCGYGVPARSTIMSYCHIHPGYTANIDLRFHRRIQETIETELSWGGCFWFDCNGNNIDDSVDIAQGTSEDLNSNDIPDECEDCNNNGILDDTDIAGGMPDVNSNGIPDECETDCNGNLIPDEYEISIESTPDDNGNNIPDECDPDCDDNGQPDFAEIAAGTKDDYDRNGIPDICQDCDTNGVTDWLDLERQHNLYLADLNDFIREYHTVSGYPIGNLGSGSVHDPYDVIFGPDRQLYVASYATDKIIRINVDNGTATELVSSGSGSLDGPTNLTFGPNGNLFVSSRLNDMILEYDRYSGAFVDTFVHAGSGGLTEPYGLEFGPDGNLYVAGSDNSIRKYSGSDGSFLSAFISPGSGGLYRPRGIVFKPDSNLLVVSNGTNEVLEYRGSSGEFLGAFNDEYLPLNGWGIRIGPNGNVFVVSQGRDRVIEYLYDNGRYYRSFVRNDPGISTPTGFDFRPLCYNDCNDNGVVDACDIASGTSEDINENGIPDECDAADSDGDGFIDLMDNCPLVYNPEQVNDDGDPYGNLCDNCPTVSNFDQVDFDGDGIGDVCDQCTDSDNDGYGDPGFPVNTCADDNCPSISNPDQANNDDDSLGNLCDNCPDSTNPLQEDADFDLVGDSCDNCLLNANPMQEDFDGDLVGDSCDNCIETFNPDQSDIDGDSIGDACDYICGDADGNEIVEVSDVVYLIAYIFTSGPPPVPVEASGDVDCNIIVEISDAVYLVAYIFTGGPEPCADCP